VKLLLVFAVLSILASSASAGALTSVNPLPGQIQPNVMIRDAEGNLYLGSGVPIPTSGLPPTPPAAVTKLSADGKVIFATTLAPNPEVGVTALALAPDGSIWAAGSVQGSFPVTKDAGETQPQGDPTGFVVRLNTSGAVIYSSYLNGISPSPSGLGTLLAMTVDNSGAVYITGQGVFNSTPGALAPVMQSSVGYFTVKLDQNGKQVWATGGIGGFAIAVDALGNVYVAGSATGVFPLPITPGAFQPSSASSNVCGSAGPAAFPCSNQYAAKLDPSGSKLIYCTWLSGSYGAYSSSLIVDGQGNAILAGTTQSSDYPTTPGAFQMVEFAGQPYFPSLGLLGSSSGPAYTGYVTKLNATGTGLIFSTYLGGSAEDMLVNTSLDAQDNVYLVGLATSPDFPGIIGVPDGCRPSQVHQVPYLTRLSADGSSLSATQLAYGVVDAQGFDASITPQSAPSAADGEGNASLAFNGSLASLSLFAPAQRFVCVTDAGDHAPITQIAPGELLELLGNNIGEPGGMSPQPVKGVIPVRFGDGSAVKIHGIAAPILYSPILYSSQDQINIQVPYEIAGQTRVMLEIDDPNGNPAGTLEFSVVSSQPRAFINGAGYASCNGNYTTSFQALALNADGSFNSCTNPAEVGSVITLFVDGPETRGVTGAIAVSPATPLALPVTVSGTAQFISAESDPGSINSVWAVKLRLAPNSSGVGTQAAEFTLTIGGVPVQDPLLVWVLSRQ
jgi:uncharacterized protein (TIGR03437 family)